MDVVEGMQFRLAAYLLALLRQPIPRDGVRPRERPNPHQREEISTMKDLLPILEQVAKMAKPLLIIAGGLYEARAALALLRSWPVVTSCAAPCRSCAVKAPGLRRAPARPCSQDIAVLRGATVGEVVSRAWASSSRTPPWPSSARPSASSSTRRNPPSLTRAAGKTAEAEFKGRMWPRSAAEIEATPTSDIHREDKLQERVLGQDRRRVAVNQRRRGHRDRDEGEEGPRRGRPEPATRASESERVEKASCHAAGGCGPGPAARGAGQDQALRRRRGRRRGSHRRAIEEPLRQIANNAAVEGSIVVEKVKDAKDAYGLQRRDLRVRGPDQRPVSSTPEGHPASPWQKRPPSLVAVPCC